MKVRVFLLAGLVFAGQNVRSADNAFPGLPVKPVTAGQTAVPQPAQVAPGDSILALDDIDRLVADERSRLATVSPQVPAQAITRLPPPIVPPSRMEVSSGVTSPLSVGLGQVNRLVTPFPEFRVQHQSTATAKKQGSVLYVTPADTQPFVVYLEDKADPRRTIGLLLRPHPDMPPVQVTLEMPGYLPTTANVPPPAAPDHISAVRSILRDLAAGQIPQGYALRAFANGDPSPRCVIPGLSVRPAQVVDGSGLVVVVAHVENTSAGDVHIEESACAEDHVLAVAAYPYTQLAPGQAGELMIAFRAHSVDAGRTRPSLLGGNP